MSDTYLRIHTVEFQFGKGVRGGQQYPAVTLYINNKKRERIVGSGFSLMTAVLYDFLISNFPKLMTSTNRVKSQGNFKYGLHLLEKITKSKLTMIEHNNKRLLFANVS